jgi:predicted RNA binding protein YcfA (HicA-like mRNA interferase family)
MPNQVNRRDVERWLLANGFEKLAGKASGHLQFFNGNIKVTLPGHGPQDLTKKHAAMLRRQLRTYGLNPEW